MSFFKGGNNNSKSDTKMEELLAQKDKEIILLQAQKKALSDKSNFHDAVLTEMILAVNS